MWYGDQFGAPQGITDRFRMSGEELCRLTLDDFKLKSKDAGPNFHAQLDVWKNGELFFFNYNLKILETIKRLGKKLQYNSIKNMQLEIMNK